MKISIEYCTLWNYEPRATRLAAEIRESYPDAEIDMIPSRGGRFEVILDGKPIFEKSKIGRHAKSGEVMNIITRELDGGRG